MLVLSRAHTFKKHVRISDLESCAITSLTTNAYNLFTDFYSLSFNQSFRWHDLSGQDLIIQDSLLPLAITQEEFSSLLFSEPAFIFHNSHILSIYSFEKIFIASTVIPHKLTKSLDLRMFPLYVSRSVLNKFLTKFPRDTTSNFTQFYNSILTFLLKTYPLEVLLSSAYRCINVVYPIQHNPPANSLQRQDRSLSITNQLLQSILPHYNDYVRISPFMLIAIRY